MITYKLFIAIIFAVILVSNFYSPVSANYYDLSPKNEKSICDYENQRALVEYVISEYDYLQKNMGTDFENDFELIIHSNPLFLQHDIRNVDDLFKQDGNLTDDFKRLDSHIQNLLLGPLTKNLILIHHLKDLDKFSKFRIYNALDEFEMDRADVKITLEQLYKHVCVDDIDRLKTFEVSYCQLENTWILGTIESIKQGQYNDISDYPAVYWTFFKNEELYEYYIIPDYVFNGRTQGQDLAKLNNAYLSDAHLVYAAVTISDSRFFHEDAFWFNPLNQKMSDYSSQILDIKNTCHWQNDDPNKSNWWYHLLINIKKVEKEFPETNSGITEKNSNVKDIQDSEKLQFKINEEKRRITQLENEKKIHDDKSIREQAYKQIKEDQKKLREDKNNADAKTVSNDKALEVKEKKMTTEELAKKIEFRTKGIKNQAGFNVYETEKPEFYFILANIFLNNTNSDNPTSHETKCLREGMGYGLMKNENCGITDVVYYFHHYNKLRQIVDQSTGMCLESINEDQVKWNKCNDHSTQKWVFQAKPLGYTQLVNMDNWHCVVYKNIKHSMSLSMKQCADKLPPTSSKQFNLVKSDVKQYLDRSEPFSIKTTTNKDVCMGIDANYWSTFEKCDPKNSKQYFKIKKYDNGMVLQSVKHPNYCLSQGLGPSLVNYYVGLWPCDDDNMFATVVDNSDHIHILLYYQNEAVSTNKKAGSWTSSDPDLNNNKSQKLKIGPPKK